MNRSSGISWRTFILFWETLNNLFKKTNKLRMKALMLSYISFWNLTSLLNIEHVSLQSFIGHHVPFSVSYQSTDKIQPVLLKSQIFYRDLRSMAWTRAACWSRMQHIKIHACYLPFVYTGQTNTGSGVHVQYELFPLKVAERYSFSWNTNMSVVRVSIW